MACLSDAYLSSGCNIKTMTNRLIATAYVNHITDEYVEFCNKNEKMPLVPANKPLKVSIFDEKNGFKVIVGTVYLSTDRFLRLVSVTNLADYEKRQFFRVSLSLKGSCQIPADNEGEEPQVQEISIGNLSLSGAYFTFDYHLDIGQRVMLILPFSSLNVIECVILRKETLDSKLFGYGCKFLEQSQKQSDLLYHYIFQEQRKMIQKAKESF